MATTLSWLRLGGPIGIVAVGPEGTGAIEEIESAVHRSHPQTTFAVLENGPDQVAEETAFRVPRETSLPEVELDEPAAPGSDQIASFRLRRGR
jgi:hypothetical protein